MVNEYERLFGRRELSRERTKTSREWGKYIGKPRRMETCERSEDFLVAVVDVLVECLWDTKNEAHLRVV